MLVLTDVTDKNLLNELRVATLEQIVFLSTTTEPSVEIMMPFQPQAGPFTAVVMSEVSLKFRLDSDPIYL